MEIDAVGLADVDSVALSDADSLADSLTENDADPLIDAVPDKEGVADADTLLMCWHPGSMSYPITRYVIVHCSLQ